MYVCIFFGGLSRPLSLACAVFSKCSILKLITTDPFVFNSNKLVNCSLKWERNCDNECNKSLIRKWDWGVLKKNN